jgi:hypothetical protein
MNTLASNHASDTADLLAKVADEFLTAKDQGLEPNVEEYAERYPEIGPILRDILPALTLMNPSLSRGDSSPPDTENLSSRTLGDFRIERSGHGGSMESRRQAIGLGERGWHDQGMGPKHFHGIHDNLRGQGDWRGCLESG